jgi:quercetin dioxygenase-like cupin family protein
MSVRDSGSIALVGIEVASGTTMQVLIDSEEGPHFAMRRFVMRPGGSMPNHTNAVEHEQYVLAGNARVGIGSDEFEVRTGSVVYIPAGVPHWYTNVGDGPFEFLCMMPNDPDKITLVE